jgi:hypothetical protein
VRCRGAPTYLPVAIPPLLPAEAGWLPQDDTLKSGLKHKLITTGNFSVESLSRRFVVRNVKGAYHLAVGGFEYH